MSLSINNVAVPCTLANVPTMSSPGCIIPAMAEGLSTEQVEVELMEGDYSLCYA